jgi:hypothetical protein
MMARPSIARYQASNRIRTVERTGGLRANVEIRLNWQQLYWQGSVIFAEIDGAEGK